MKTTGGEVSEKGIRMPLFSRLLQQAILLLVMLCICFVVFNEFDDDVRPAAGTVTEEAESPSAEVQEQLPVSIYLFYDGEKGRAKAQDEEAFFRMAFRDAIADGNIRFTVLDVGSDPEKDKVFGANKNSLVISYKGHFSRYHRTGGSQYLYAACDEVNKLLKETE
ncbi:MAG: hypothetical protein J6S21_05510 [Victivallales bacterium]|nr:hypothetical protein [Victivallales bacterium]